MLTADPAERPTSYDTTLANLLAYRARIINASESREATTLRRVLDGTAQMKSR